MVAFVIIVSAQVLLVLTLGLLWLDNYLTLIIPSCFSVHKISERHQLLRATISSRQEENDSYEMVTYLNNCLTPIFLTALCLEILFFYVYNNMVK